MRVDPSGGSGNRSSEPEQEDSAETTAVPNDAISPPSDYDPDPDPAPSDPSTSDPEPPDDAISPPSDYDPDPDPAPSDPSTPDPEPPDDAISPPSDYDPNPDPTPSNPSTPDDALAPPSDYDPNPGTSDPAAPDDAIAPPRDYNPNPGASDPAAPDDAIAPPSDYDPAATRTQIGTIGPFSPSNSGISRADDLDPEQRRLLLQRAAEDRSVDPSDLRLGERDGEYVAFLSAEARQREAEAEIARDLGIAESGIVITDSGEVELTSSGVEEYSVEARIEAAREYDEVDWSDLEADVLEGGEVEIGIREEENQQENDDEGGIRGWLESASDTFQGWADQSGEVVEDVLPSTPVLLRDPYTGFPVASDRDVDDISAIAVETGVSTLDPPGAVLSGIDMAEFAASEVSMLREYQIDQAAALQEMGVSGAVDDPADAAATAADATTGAGYIADRGDDAATVGAAAADAAIDEFSERPIETSAAVLGGGVAAIVAPTAAVRSVSRLQRVDWSPRGNMISRGPDRGQMDITITRERTRDIDDLPIEERPADPTAPTAEGRTPPREAFQSEEAYQEAVRRRQDEIEREFVEQQPPEFDPDATPVERVRASRDEFDDWDEFQRELQEAREQMQRQQFEAASETRAVFGDPSVLEETSTDLFADTDVNLDTATAFDEPEGLEETSTDLFADTETALDSAVASDSPTELEEMSDEVVTASTEGMGITAQTSESTEVGTETQVVEVEVTALETGVLGEGQAQTVMDETLQTRPPRLRPPFPDFDGDPGDEMLFDDAFSYDEIDTGIAGVDDLVGDEFDQLDDEFDTGFAGVDDLVGDDFDQLDDELDTGFADVDDVVGDDFGQLDDELDEEIDEMFRF